MAPIATKVTALSDNMAIHWLVIGVSTMPVDVMTVVILTTVIFEYINCVQTCTHSGRQHNGMTGICWTVLRCVVRVAQW